MGVRCRFPFLMLWLTAASVCRRRNNEGVQVGSIIRGIAEFNLVGSRVQGYLNHGTGWRTEAVAIQGDFLRGIPIDRNEERSLALGHVIDLHLVSARNRHIHVVEGDGAL